MKNDNQITWWNYKTNQFDAILGKPSDYSLYIPQDMASQGIYKILIELGNTPEQAAIDVLSRHIKKLPE